MNPRSQEVFRGKIVNKAHIIGTGVDGFPPYVLRYRISNSNLGRYNATS